MLLLLAALGGEEKRFEAVFTPKGARGNLEVKYEQARISKEEGETFLVLDKAGSSKLISHISLAHPPRRAVFEIHARTKGLMGAFYSLRVNDRYVVERVEFKFDLVTSSGYDVTRFLRPGENEIEVALLPGSASPLLVKKVVLILARPRIHSVWLTLIGISFILAFWVPSRLFFELLWWGGRGMRPVLAMWLSLFLGCIVAVVYGWIIFVKVL